MNIKRISIKNYMSIGEPIEITLKDKDKLTLVGENNVGKSCILKALHRCLNFESGPFVEEEWHKADTTRTIEITLEVSLEDEELAKILGFLNLPSSVLDEVKRYFGEILQYNCKKSLNTLDVCIKWGNLCIYEAFGYIPDRHPTAEYETIPWYIIRSEYEKNQKSLKSVIEKKINEVKQYAAPQARVRIDFQTNLKNQVVGLLRESIVYFPEFREIPQKLLTDFLISTTGRELASVLFNLKNGRRRDKEKFREIQQRFTQLFPDLELDAIRENDEIKICITRGEVESTTGFFGAGIFEMILFLTHIIAHKNKILCIDEPELHLHPQAQKLLASFVEESNGNQFLMITHSPFFISPSRLDDVIRVVQRDGQTLLLSPPSGYWTPKDLEKLGQFLDASNLELFFARKVLLVEGQTEVGTFPILSKETYDFFKYGVSTIGVDGKQNFPIFIKMLEGFKIPYVVILDTDINDPRDGKFQEKIKKLIKGSARVVVLPGNFEEVVEKHQPGLLEDVRKKVGKGKPRVGRYIALELIKRKDVPPEFFEVIETVKECV